MKNHRFEKNPISVILLFLWLIFPVFAVPPSPAGGGWLEIFQEGDYASVEDSDDFDVNLARKEFTIEMWVYFKRPPQPGSLKGQLRERWAVIYKEGSYELELFPEAFNIDFEVSPPRLGGLWGFHLDEGLLSVNQWNYIAMVVDGNSVQRIVNGDLRGLAKRHNKAGLPLFDDSDSPLCIGGGHDPNIWEGLPTWKVFTGGLIDEVRISDIARYPKEKINNRLWRDVVDIPEVPFEPDEHTLALWHFDGRGSQRLRDASGNGHHLGYSAYGIEPSGKLPVLWGQIKR